MSNIQDAVLEARDEGLHAIAVFEYLNSISVFLEFSASVFELKSVERNTNKDIIASVFEMYPRYLELYLKNYPVEVNGVVSMIKLMVDINHSDETIKAILEVANNSGEITSIEVT